MSISLRDEPLDYLDQNIYCQRCLPHQMCDPGLEFRINSNRDYSYWHYLEATEPRYQEDLDALMPNRVITFSTCGILDGNIHVRENTQYPWRYQSYSPYLSMGMSFDQIYSNEFQYMSGQCDVDVEPLRSPNYYAGMNRTLTFTGGGWYMVNPVKWSTTLTPGDYCWSVTINMTHCIFRMRDLEIVAPKPFPDKNYNPSQPLRMSLQTPYTSGTWFSGCDWHMYYMYIGEGEKFPPKFQTQRGTGTVRKPQEDYPGSSDLSYKYWRFTNLTLTKKQWVNPEWRTQGYTAIGNFTPQYLGCLQEHITLDNDTYLHRGTYNVHPALAPPNCVPNIGLSLNCSINSTDSRLFCPDATLCRRQRELVLTVEQGKVVSHRPAVPFSIWDRLNSSEILSEAVCTHISSDIYTSEVDSGLIVSSDECGNMLSGEYRNVCNYTYVEDRQFLTQADCVMIDLPDVPECDTYVAAARGDIYQFIPTSSRPLCNTRPGCAVDRLDCNTSHILCTSDKEMSAVLSICTPLQEMCAHWTVKRTINQTIFLPDPGAVAATLGGVVAIIVLVVLAALCQICIILWYARSKFCKPCRQYLLREGARLKRKLSLDRMPAGAERFSVRRYLRRTQHQPRRPTPARPTAQPSFSSEGDPNV